MRIAFIPFFLLLIISANAQDKIINSNHDTIHCTILSISPEQIIYEIKNKDGSVTGKFISTSQVAEYSRSHPTDLNSKNHKTKTDKHLYIVENPWCFGLSTGGSTMPWYFDNIESSTTIPDYYNKLKTGFHISPSIHYLITDYFGLGAEYSFLKTSTSGSMQIVYAPSMYLLVAEEGRQYIHYLGPSVFFQQKLDKQGKLIFRESLSGGAMFIRLENQISYPTVEYDIYTDLSNNMLLTGQAFSAKFGLSAEYKILPELSVGLAGDFIWGTLKKADMESKSSNNQSSSFENEELSKPLNLSRFDYSVVFHYHF